MPSMSFCMTRSIRGRAGSATTALGSWWNDQDGKWNDRPSAERVRIVVGDGATRERDAHDAIRGALPAQRPRSTSTGNRDAGRQHATECGLALLQMGFA